MKRPALQECSGNDHRRKRSKRICSVEDCAKFAQGKTDKCKAHGGGKRCTEEGCTKSAQGKTDKCIEHGGGKRCTEEGCTKSAEGKTDKCKAHGGGKRCTEEGCTKSAEGKTDKCVEHGGGRRCTEEGCTKSAQGKTDKCKAHGGGKRCTEEGCTKSAIGKTDKCKAHGGGKRCTEKGCTKSAIGKTDKCKAHGGGKHCTEKGCTKSARGKTDKCIEHGGGKRCTEKGCIKSAQGKTDKCVGHGGGKRCEACCALLQQPNFATHSHPETGIGLCTAAARNMVMEAINNDDDALADKLKRYFGFKRDLIIRPEHVFYHELVKRVPKLATTRRVLDETVLAKLLGKQKCLEDPRPDYFHFYPMTNIALHGEFDETPEHEDNDCRLDTIAHHAGCGRERVYVFRIQARIGSSREICRRVVCKDMAFYQMTDEGYRVLDRVVEYVREHLDYMEKGLVPDESVGRTRKRYFE